MKLAEIFSDNIVFQANKKICIFGVGEGQVCVEFLGKRYTQSFCGDKWALYLDAHPYGGPYEMTVDLNGEKRILKNIMLGEVILCTGQSNMQFTVADEKNGEEVCANEMVRCFVSDRIEEHGGIHSADGWQLGRKDKLGNFSALGFHVADRISREKGVAVGIVGCFQGASGIRSWLSEEWLTEETLLPIEALHGDYTHELYSKWNGVGMLYRHTFFPIVPFVFSFVMWYQGESDTVVAEKEEYEILLKKMICGWRKDLKQEELPFVVIQICDFSRRDDEGWRVIQRVQEKVVKFVPKTALVTSSDVCDHDDVHPGDKRGLAEKVADVYFSCGAKA